MPKLSPPKVSDKMSFLFPLVDVSGSMHAKLADAIDQICSKFLQSSDANVAGLMAFTTTPYLIVPPSGIVSEVHRNDFRKAVRSLFIPAHSGTDIPTAVLSYLQESRSFLEKVPARSSTDMWKANFVIITDGLHKVDEATWDEISRAVSVTRNSARAKNCYLFFFLLNLQSDDVDKKVLDRLSRVLRAERALRVGLQPMQAGWFPNMGT